MPDNLFNTHSPSMTAPLMHVFDITPGAALKYVTRAIMVGSEGSVRVTTLGGETITTLALAPGVWHPIMATAVLAGGTATAIQGGC